MGSVEVVASSGAREGTLTMQPVSILAARSSPLRVLALGAHCDDIEIGCGGTLLRLAGEREHLEVRWVAFSSTAARAEEGRASAAAFLEGVARSEVTIGNHRDGFLPRRGLPAGWSFSRPIQHLFSYPLSPTFDFGRWRALMTRYGM